MKKWILRIGFIALTGLTSIALADNTSDTYDANAAQQQTSDNLTGDNLKTPDQADNLKTPDQANVLKTPDEAEAYKAAHPDENPNDLNRGGPLQPAQALPPATAKPYQPVDPRQSLYPDKTNAGTATIASTPSP